MAIIRPDHPTIHTRRSHHVLSSTLEPKDATAIPHDYPVAADVLNAASLYRAQHGKVLNADDRAEAAAAPQALMDVAKGLSQKVKGPKPTP